MKVAVLFSGGKDSTFAIQRAMQQGREIAVLVAMKSANPASYMFHIPNIDLVEQQAKVLEIPLVFKKTAGIKEKELKDLKAVLQAVKKKYKIEGVVSGAVASEYQRYRVESICADLGLKSIAPLWHLDPERYITELIKDNFEVYITAVAADGFDHTWLGRKLDLQTLEDLKRQNQKFGIHVSGEGGEYETFVADCPIFKKKIIIQQAEKIWKNDSGRWLIKNFKLIKK